MHCTGGLHCLSPLITDSVSLLSCLNRFKLQLVRLGLRKNNFLVVKIGEHLKFLPVEGYWNSISVFSRHLSGMAGDCVTEIEKSWVCLWAAVCIRWSCSLTSAYVVVLKEVFYITSPCMKCSEGTEPLDAVWLFSPPCEHFQGWVYMKERMDTRLSYWIMFL